MNNILSNRLLTIASMIPKDKVVYDVGCDHAYLDIYLTLNNNNKCYAIDVRKKVVEIARKNIEKFNLDIPVLLNTGIENLEIKNNSIVVIAGMGTRNILKILKDKDIDEFLIQSNDDLPLLRESLSKQGFLITDEKVVFEANYYYVLIKFKKGDSKYTKDELLLGPILMKNTDNDVYLNYLNHLLNKFNKMLLDVPEALSEKKHKLLMNLNIVQQYLAKLK